jgi:hypothetical protein
MRTRSLGLVLVSVCAVLLSACPSEVSIGKLNSDPGRYHNREVVIRGTVLNAYGALGQGVYEVGDESGSIWVLTQRGVPTKGARVRVIGKAVSGVTWAGRTLGNAVQEKNRQY